MSPESRLLAARARKRFLGPDAAARRYAPVELDADERAAALAEPAPRQLEIPRVVTVALAVPASAPVAPPPPETPEIAARRLAGKKLADLCANITKDLEG